MSESDTPEVSKQKKGVCYMQTIPPFMNADFLRKQLQKRFQIGRIYLEPEAEHITRHRQKTGGNRKTNYVEGWIEFERKKDAKLAALALNGQLFGGKKRHNDYHDCIWNLKYLSGFQWHHLTEKLAYDQKMRQARLKSSLTKADKEIQFYREKAEMAETIQKIEQRREQKALQEDESDASNNVDESV